MNIELQGGKTAPRLLLDLTQYDPLHLSPTGFNYLSDLVVLDEGRSAPPLPTKGNDSCRHEWALKKDQCELSDEDPRAPSRGAKWRFAAFCVKCRCHLDLHFSYPGSKEDLRPCSTETHPLHHFIHHPHMSTSWRSRTRILNPPGFAWGDRQCFECTSSECGAKVVIQIKPPRLTAEWVALLTDKQLIRERAEQAMAKDPQKFEGIAIPTSVNVLEYLLQYIKNSLFAPDPSRKINSDNKKFATSLGDACSGLLQYIGFTRDGDVWRPPNPPPEPEVPYADLERIVLDDVKEELCALMSKEPTEQVRSTKFVFQPAPAIPEMGTVFACRDYTTTRRSRNVDLTIEEHPFYGGLGALADFHDELLRFAYTCQVSCDPKNIPYYLECLQVLAVGRESEDLQTLAAIEQTEGRISLKDVRNAYSHLGLDANNRQLSDETIIGNFHARISDAPKQEAELRNDLRVIGESRLSEKIRLAASQDLVTYEQALHFLGVHEHTTDDFVTSMFGVKVGEKPSDEPVARKAVILIANHRKSKALRSWLETGHLGEMEMDVGQAYARLDISDRTVDDTAVLASYEVNVDEQPSQIEDLNRALTAIARSRDSKTLLERLGLESGATSYKISEWPVGIENIGNTCYLNSLLQFYFTIKPLRDLVLNIDEHKMPTDEESLKSKRVGSRNVSRKEVDRAQRFVDELRSLFTDLITSNKKSFKPSPDVARLTLLSSSKAEIARRQSLISAERPAIGSGLGQINGVSVQGPEGPPPSESVEDASTILDDDANQNPQDARESTDTNMPIDDDQQSNTSSETLMDGAPVAAAENMEIDPDITEKQQQALEDKENMPPTDSTHTESGGKEGGASDLKPLEEASSPRLNEKASQIQVSSDVSNWIDLTGDSEAVLSPTDADKTAPTHTPPKRPPPFPPRPQPQREASDAIKEAEYGAQQDVTEVIANVLFQLQCAIKPESVDESGEQLDQIKSLFFGKQKSYTTDRTGTIRTKEEYITDIKVDVASGPRDIYAALDGAFDVQDVEVGGGIEPQYATISQLPPVLSILIQRAQFDPTKKTTFKSDNHLELKETIYMDRYMDSKDSGLDERREENWAWKRQLAALEKRRAQFADSEMGMSIPEILGMTQDYLEQVRDLDDDEVEVPESLIANVESAAEEARAELTGLETDIRDKRANITSQFSDLRNIAYRLAAVFIHVGSHNAGHYWIYIYDFNVKTWRKYNDEKVTEVADTKEIFEAPGTIRPPTPYYLVYVRNDIKESLIDPVCRDVVEPPAGLNEDTTMDDYEDVPVTSQMIEDAYAPIMSQNQQVAHDGWHALPPNDQEHQW